LETIRFPPWDCSPVEIHFSYTYFRIPVDTDIFAAWPGHNPLFEPQEQRHESNCQGSAVENGILENREGSARTVRTGYTIHFKHPAFSDACHVPNSASVSLVTLLDRKHP